MAEKRETNGHRKRSIESLSHEWKKPENLMKPTHFVMIKETGFT